jgi:hypothetical protein
MRSPARTKPRETVRQSRRCASAPARYAVAPRARRGSALVIVIGTLALISVFAAIYISVGQSDRQSAATVRTRTDLSEITGAYADHVARVIAADRLDTIMQPVDSARQFQVPRRVTTDAPYTDWAMRSETDELWRLFSPPGGNRYARPRNQTGDDPRVASDPWLAALRPTYLGDPNIRPFSGNNPAKYYLDNRDWYQISNFAEDGRFVNLFNLRPESAFSTDGTAFGGFEAEPGYGVSIDSTGRRIRRLSEGLSLYTKLIPTDPNSPIQSYNPDPAGDGVPALRGLLWFPGASLPVLPIDFTGNFTPQDYRNTPAIFSMYQRYAFLPADQPFVTYNRFGQVASWADPDYPPYQWADADGDGMMDSRWIELTSARTPAPSGRARDDIQRFYDDSEYRVFAAIRAVDLSGMVNVNTAVDGLTPPTVNFPLGLTPAEIDLRRLLTQQDSANDYRGDPAATLPLSFRYIHQPYNIQGTGTQPALRIESDYRIHQHTLDPGTGLLNPDTSGMLVGRYAAAAIRRGMDRHATLSPQYRGFGSVAPDFNDPFLLQEGSSLQRQPVFGNPESDFDYYAGGRAASYYKVGRVDPSRIGPSGLAPYGSDADDYLTNTDYYDAPNENLPFALYGTTDLAELLTYHGINDPEVTSRLEANMQGRFDGPNGEARLSPLLSTRPLDLDRYKHGQVRVPPANTNPNRPRQINGQIAEDSMALFELSPRALMTPLSGASPLRPMGVAGGTIQAQGALATNIQPAGLANLSTAEAAITLADVAEGSDSRQAFDVFYSALAGELELFRQKRSIGQDGPPPGVINQIWQPDLFQSRALPYATTFYAHRGPELAMRIAAHAGVNLKDMYDGNQTPSYGSLVLDNEFGDSTAYSNLLSAVTNNPQTFDLTAPSGLLGVYYPGLIGTGRFDIDGPRDAQTPDPLPDDQRVLPDARLPVGRQAVNVVGVEPTPVITEVSSFYVYTDASQSAGGDDDASPAPNPAPGRPVPLTAKAVTLNGSLSQGNSDFLTAVLAVQLHNPFDTAISLGGSAGPNGIMWRKNDNGNRFDPQNNLEFAYYIEYNGHFFKLGEFWEFTPQASLPSGFGASQTTITNAGGSVPPENSRLDSAYPEFQYRNVTLDPGETRVFYATFHPRFEGDNYLNAAGLEYNWVRNIQAYGTLPAEFTDTALHDADGDGRADGFDNRGWTGPAQEWIERQLAVLPETGATGVLRAARMHPFDPTTGELIDPATGTTGPNPVFHDLIGTPGSVASLPGRPADNGQVRLWRKYTEPNYEEATGQVISNFPNATRRNIVQNDILADRLFLTLPSEAGTNYLDVALPGSNQEIEGTISFPETYNIVADPCNSNAINVRNDNTGLSVTRWATVRRRDRQASLTDETANGRVLPWMIQSRQDRASTWIRSNNKDGHPDAAPEAFGDALTWDLFFDLCNAGDSPDRPATPVTPFGVTDGRRYDIAYSPIDLYNDALLRRGSRVATIGNTPFNKREAALLGNSGTRFPVRTLGSNRLAAAHELFAASSPLKPEVYIGKTLNSARIGEALLALGTGPTWAPVVRPLNNFTFEDREWMTLTESFAAALGYERFDLTDPLEVEAANAVWHDAARDVVGSTQGEYVLDNLRLRLDDYVPFLNIRSAGETGPNEKPAFTNDPGNPATTDYRRGLGVPMALTVLDQLRPFEVLDLPGDGSLSPEEEAVLPLTRPIMGLVNIQTAPLKVLRLLPGLTPSPEAYRAFESSSGTSARRPEWWGAPFGLATNTGAAELLPADPRTNPDVAAGLVAYRDRTVAVPRARSTNAALEPLTYQPDLNFNAGWFVQNMRAEVVNTVFPVDRAGISGIPGLRSAPMFASLGEMLAVAVKEPASGFSDPLADNRRHLTMQAYFGDGNNLTVDGTGDDAVTIDPSVSRDGTVGVTEDDYAERLALAAGLLNNTTVRSDYFAVWMVLQGFRESDVTRLRPEDPLVPSFKKRYLMVIDRSNVLSPEDTPRIVLFKELPL